MFCTKCGKALRDGSLFCASCGTRIASDDKREVQSSTDTSVLHPILDSDVAKESHPYTNMGGWLALFTYAQFIVGVISMVSGTLVIVSALPYLRFLEGWHILAIVLGFVSIIVSFYVMFCLFQMIRKRDCDFLGFYEIWMIMELAVLTISVVLGLSESASTLRNLVSSGISFVIWDLYFRKSVRVRTYFGTDAYIRRSLFGGDA